MLASNHTKTARWNPLFFTLGLLALLSAGCSPVPDRPARPQAKAAETPPASLEILVVGDPQLADQVARGWQAEGRGEARVSEQTLEAWQTEEFPIDPKVDVVVFPGQLQNDENVAIPAGHPLDELSIGGGMERAHRVLEKAGHRPAERSA